MCVCVCVCVCVDRERSLWEVGTYIPLASLCTPQPFENRLRRPANSHIEFASTCSGSSQPMKLIELNEHSIYVGSRTKRKQRTDISE